jgi:hypothetical protein
MEDLTIDLDDLSLDQVHLEVKHEYQNGEKLLEEIERFARHAQKELRYRRERIQFSDLKRDIQHDLKGLEKVRASIRHQQK